MVTLAPKEHIQLEGKASYHGTSGTLYLTNKKLEFEYKKRGILFKGKYSAVSLPLERIVDVSVIGVGPFKKISVTMLKGAVSSGLPRYEFKLKEPETWKTKIEDAKSVGKTPKEVITREVVKVRCRFCGMLAEPTLSTCPNCGGILS